MSMAKRMLRVKLITVCAIFVFFGSVRYKRTACDFLQYNDSCTSTQTNVTDVLFPSKPLVIWSMEYHIAGIRDTKHLLTPMGVRFIDKSLAGMCDITNTCKGKKSLKIINSKNVLNFNYSLIPKFYDAYKDDDEMKTVDAFFCFYPTAICEIFMPFNKSLIVMSPTRYEVGRFGMRRWTKWNNNLLQIANTPGNVVAGTNLYDVNYIKYFTGFQPQLIPSYCGYSRYKYSPSRPGFILHYVIRNGAFGKIFNKVFTNKYKNLCTRLNCTAKLIPFRQRYGRRYKYSDMAAHMGIVHIPYQVAIMSMLEHYRMNIPLFYPSLDLLTKWQHRYMVSKCFSDNCIH